MEPLAWLGILAIVIGIIGVIILLKGRKKTLADRSDGLMSGNHPSNIPFTFQGNFTFPAASPR